MSKAIEFNLTNKTKVKNIFHENEIKEANKKIEELEKENNSLEMRNAVMFTVALITLVIFAII